MLTVIAVDDQPIMLEAVKRALKPLCFVKLIAATTSPTDALAYCEQTKPHVALLDIDMPELDGIHFAEALTQKSPETAVIFITSHANYIRDAFKVYAYDFIEKPLDMARLESTLKRLYHQVGEDQAPLSLPTEDGLLYVKPSDIVAVEATGKHCIVSDLKKQYTIKLSLKEMEERLTEPCFFKSGRSFIVNLGHVAGIENLSRTSYAITFKYPHAYAQLSKNLYDDFKCHLEKII